MSIAHIRYMSSRFRFSAHFLLILYLFELKASSLLRSITKSFICFILIKEMKQNYFWLYTVWLNTIKINLCSLRRQSDARTCVFIEFIACGLHASTLRQPSLRDVFPWFTLVVYFTYELSRLIIYAYREGGLCRMIVTRLPLRTLRIPR